jgi:hypothetical protein
MFSMGQVSVHVIKIVVICKNTNGETMVNRADESCEPSWTKKQEFAYLLVDVPDVPSETPYMPQNRVNSDLRPFRFIYL